MTRKNKSGFTLAEVLVTLAVIGIVAALAVPSLLNNTNQQEYKTGLKKAVALLNQTIQLKIARDGQDASSTNIGSATALAQYFENEMRVIKTESATQFHTADGLQYSFSWSAGGCLNTDTLDTSAKCTVIVDVNGDKGPNVISSGTTYKDQYVLIVQNSAIVPPQTGGNIAAQNAMTQ